MQKQTIVVSYNEKGGNRAYVARFLVKRLVTMITGVEFDFL